MRDKYDFLSEVKHQSFLQADIRDDAHMTYRKIV